MQKILQFNKSEIRKEKNARGFKLLLRMVELLQKISRFVHGSKLKYYRDDQQTVTNCGARDESIVRESKSILHNGEHPSARRDRIGNNYPSRVSPSECEAITQCLITISACTISRIRRAAIGCIANFHYRDLDLPSTHQRRRFDLHTLETLLTPPRALDFALDKFIPRL